MVRNIAEIVPCMIGFCCLGCFPCPKCPLNGSFLCVSNIMSPLAIIPAVVFVDHHASTDGSLDYPATGFLSWLSPAPKRLRWEMNYHLLGVGIQVDKIINDNASVVFT
jgi:hypothetical protein